MGLIIAGSIVFCGALRGMLHDNKNHLNENYLFVVAAVDGLSLALRGGSHSAWRLTPLRSLPPHGKLKTVPWREDILQNGGPIAHYPLP